MPSWSLELVPGPSEAEQSRQLQIKRPRVDMSSQGTGTGLEVAGAAVDHAGRKPKSKQKNKGGAAGGDSNDPSLVSLVLSLESKAPRCRSGDLLCRAGAEGDVFTLQKHEGGWQEVRTRSGQSAPPRVPGPPVHTGHVRASARSGPSSVGQGRGRQNVAGKGHRASDAGRAGRMGHDVPSRGLLRQASAGETGSHPVRHERSDGSVVAPFRPETSNPASSSWAAPTSRRNHDEADERTERARLALVRARWEAQPIETQVGQASQRITRLQKEFAQAVDARQNAERLLRDTKEKAIRIADELDQAEIELRDICSKKAAAEGCKDRSPRIDLAQLLEPDAANRIILDDIGVIGDESELDITDDERAAYQAHKKKFAEDMVAAVQSSWSSLRQIFEAKRARETQKQWIKKRKVEIVEIGSRIYETTDFSDLGDMVDIAPVTEKEATGEGNPGCVHQGRSSTPQERQEPSLTRVVRCSWATPQHWGPAACRYLQQSPYDVVGYVETHVSPTASQDLLRDFDKAGRKAVLSLARPKSGGTSGGVAWEPFKRDQASSYRQLARDESQCLGALDAGHPMGHFDCFDFVPLCLHLKGVNIVLVLLYLTCSIGLTGENLQKISSLLAFIHCIKDPRTVVGDLNVSPSTLLAQTWFQDMGLHVLAPANFEVGPTGSLIDFAFAPAAGAAFVDSIMLDDQVPCKTHFLTIKADAAYARLRHIPTPRRFRHPPRPRRSVDPASKSAKKKKSLASPKIT